MSYLRVGEAGIAAWEISIGSVGSIKVDGISSSYVPWPGEGGLARCREDEF